MRFARVNLDQSQGPGSFLAAAILGISTFATAPDPAIEFWDGETKEIGLGLTLIRCGGHFDGGTVLHWPEGADGKGAILSGDILQVVQDRCWVSFMYSYPNLIPLSASTVRRIIAAVEPFGFERIYGAWWGKVVAPDAKAAVRRSSERYIRAISE